MVTNNKAKANWTVVILLLLTAIVIGGGIYWWQKQEESPEPVVVTSTPEATPTSTPSPSPTEGLEYTDVTPEEAKSLIDTKADLVVIDVSPNYDEGHLPGAVNYYVGDGSLDEVIPNLDKTKEYLVYCHVDSASINGAQKLIDAGFEKVYRLKGNYQAWIDAGHPIED